MITLSNFAKITYQDILESFAIFSCAMYGDRESSTASVGSKKRMKNKNEMFKNILKIIYRHQIRD